MLIDGDTLSQHTRLETQVCIIGGGVAGITLANELKNQFEDIILVESGGQGYVQFAQDLYQAESFPYPLPDPHYGRLRFLGGSSNHWQNSTAPLSPIDFKKRDWIPHSGWPITYQDVAPYYPKAGEYCGIGKEGFALDYWQDKLKGTDPLASSNTLKAQIGKASVPPVRFFAAHGQPLINASNVRVLTNSNLIDVAFDKARKHITSAELACTKGNKIQVQAKYFVLATGGIENARLLLALNQKYQNKLGNQGDAVGRYFMEHPTPRAANLITDKLQDFAFFEPVFFGEKRVVALMSLTESALAEHGSTNLRMPLAAKSHYDISRGIDAMHTLGPALADFSIPEHAGTHLYNLVSDLDMVIEAIARKQFDTKVFDHASEIAGFQLPMMMEQTPDPANRITLGSKKDALGMPQISIDYRITEQDKTRVWKSLQAAAREIGALDIGRMQLLKEKADRLWSEQLGFSNHHMGTTRMAATPEQGVVDGNALVFGTNNLFIAGSSVFTTGGHVPPTLTIVALSIRLAEHLKHA